MIGVDGSQVATVEQADGSRKPVSGIDALRLLCAFQALTMPSGFYRVTHTRARQAIEQITGKRPKRGAKPVQADGSPCTTLDTYLAWHGFTTTEGATEGATDGAEVTKRR